MGLCSAVVHECLDQENLSCEEHKKEFEHDSKSLMASRVWQSQTYSMIVKSSGVKIATTL
jgi:hypothetical protein